MARTTFKWLACCALVLLLGACAAPDFKTPTIVPVYAGEHKPLDQVAVLRSHQLISIFSVDGVRLNDYIRPEFPSNFGGWEVELLPGEHVIAFHYAIRTTQTTEMSRSPVSKTIKVEAGHIYARDFAATPARGRWDVEITDVTGASWADAVATRAKFKLTPPPSSAAQ